MPRLNEPKAAIDSRNASAYYRDLVPAFLGYAIVLAIVLSLIGDEIDGPGEWLLLLLPVVPALWGVRAVVRHLRRIDEYQRLLLLEALAAGFGAAMVAAITIGFLGVGGVASRATGWIVYGVGMVTTAIVAVVQARR